MTQAMLSTGRKRKITKQVNAGGLLIGGNAPVSIQSMVKHPTGDTNGCLSQIAELKKAGADLVRLAIRDKEALPSLGEIVKSAGIPLCADIHFDHRLAIACIELGIAKIRINPGNIGSSKKVKEVVKAAGERLIPVRIGVNAGSVNRRRYESPTPEALVYSALEHIKILEDCGYDRIVVSIKSSNPSDTIEANLIMSETRDYPLHIGLTEAGYGMTGAIQSSVVTGHLLLNGIGDTIRVSMTGNPVEEILAAKKILETTGDRTAPFRIISCPTCGRASSESDILSIAKAIGEQAEQELTAAAMEKRINLTVAVMGCEVNGPGEAADADCGVAGTPDGRFLLFAKGKKISIISRESAVTGVINRLRDIINDR